MTLTSPAANQTVPLREAVSFYIGGGWGKEEPDQDHTTGAWVIRGTDIPHLRRGDASTCVYRFHRPSNLKSRRLADGDLVLEVSGGSKDQPVGRSVVLSPRLLSRFPEGVICASFCKLVRPDAETIDSVFLYYYLLHIYDNREIIQYQVQSTGISNFKFEQFLDEHAVDLPPLVIQRTIADILSAYDDLIENNTRRIAILEEMARALYREWFVDFRFPGHDGVGMVESEIGPVPEGWTVSQLSALVETQYGYTESAQTTEVGPKFVRGMDINKNSYIQWQTVPYCSINASDQVRYRLGIGDILVIRMADPGKVGIVERAIDAVFASYLIRLRINSPTLLPYYLFYFLTSDRYQGYVTGASTGTTRKSASAGVITDIGLVIPPKSVRWQYENYVSDLRRALNNLLTRTANLARTRDLLLPKLVSGEVVTETMEVDLPRS